MTKSALVKIGVPSAQAESMKWSRRVRQIIEQEDAAIARIHAATAERIRALVNEQFAPEAETEAADEPPTAATA